MSPSLDDACTPTLTLYRSNVQTFQTYGANSPSNPFQAMRNIGTSQLITAGVVAAEMIGFFTVGEMVGRMKLIGYRSSSHGEHH